MEEMGTDDVQLLGKHHFGSYDNLAFLLVKLEVIFPIDEGMGTSVLGRTYKCADVRI